MIQVENLTRKYGDFTAVDNVSFSIPRGQVVGLLGHNGAGKTTIMKVLTGFLEPTAGKVTIAGLNLETHRLEAQAKIGYLPEHSPLYPEMSVVEYLAYVCQLRSIPAEKRQEAISRALDRTALKDRAFDKIYTLSKGYRQRVGVAQAILHKPEILIMDEATSGLDPAQIQVMRTLILELCKDAAVILSTHIMQEVEAVCGRVLIISQGKLVADAQLEDLRNSQRVVVDVDQDAGVVAPVLRSIDGVEVAECVRESIGSRLFLQCGERAEALIPEIARKVVEQGWRLRQIGREQRSLETVFREVSR